MEEEQRRWSPARGAAVGAVALLIVSAAMLALDQDRDGASTWRELRAGTSAWDGDSDGDGLEDGWELGAGLDALAADSEGDGLADAAELRGGSDPLRPDSDDDGLADRDEAALPDCDGDGLPAAAEGDGDDDGRLDALEAAADRCVRDADGDGVADGAEGRGDCVHATDCDADGVPDGNETDGFDPLDPDSFGSGVSDGVSYAFQQSGQRPGADGDGDGIPDGWEDAEGLIAWGDLRPRVGERDLLVEFLRVQGPDSGRPRYAAESFAPAYEAVAAALRAERGLHLRWVETVVGIEEEVDPPLVPELEEPYYADVLARGAHSENPYVTTVVLNPQHDQSQVAHSGIAPIRGMLAAVDYGTQVRVDFDSEEGRRISLTPAIESLIRGGRQDLLSELGFRGGYTDGGDIGLESTETGALILWKPSWFRTAPRIVDGNETLQLRFDGVTVFQGSLAGTILHELGHTLGLCHAHEPECSAAFTAEDRARQAESTMSYDAPSNRLHFLDSEWTTVLEYVSCPPDAPVTLVAQGAGTQAVFEAKYGYANQDLEDLGLRSCNDFQELAREFEPNVPAAATYVAPTRYLDPADDPDGPALFVAALVVALLLAAGAAVAAARFLTPRAP